MNAPREPASPLISSDRPAHCFPGAPGAEVELTQGDIAVSDVVREAFRFRRVKRGATARQKLWPKNSAGNAVIPYVIESSAGTMAPPQTAVPLGQLGSPRLAFLVECVASLVVSHFFPGHSLSWDHCPDQGGHQPLDKARAVSEIRAQDYSGGLH